MTYGVKFDILVDMKIPTHYHTNRVLHFINALAECFILFGVFVVSGYIRAVLPFGLPFSMRDVCTFLPLGVGYAVVMVLSYAFVGDYSNIHYPGVVKETVKVGLINLFGLAFMATILYTFQLLQFSRMWLGYFYLLSVIAILFKRILFSRIASAYAQRTRLTTRVLMIGGGSLARSFHAAVLSTNVNYMHLVGYLAEQSVAGLDNYLGTKDKLQEALELVETDVILVAEDCQDMESFASIMQVADRKKIRVCVLPVYNEYMGNLAKHVTTVGSYKLMELLSFNTCNIMGVDVAVSDMEKTIRLIDSHLESWRGEYICVANVHTTVTAYEDEVYRNIQNGAVMALADGGPLSQYSREHGYEEALRVTGPDLMRELLKQSGEKGWRHYFYGSTEKTLQDLKKRMESEYPGAVIAGMYSPPFRVLTEEEDQEVIRMINDAAPDFLWVGLGAPKQEQWMAAHKGKVSALMIGVGAAFDYEAGNIQRAPEWMQKHSLEWLYRLLQDPKRLFRRYVTTNFKYLWWKLWQ